MINASKLILSSESGAGNCVNEPEVLRAAGLLILSCRLRLEMQPWAGCRPLDEAPADSCFASQQSGISRNKEHPAKAREGRERREARSGDRENRG